jgi:hypothetical protein
MWRYTWVHCPLSPRPRVAAERPELPKFNFSFKKPHQIAYLNRTSPISSYCSSSDSILSHQTIDFLFTLRFAELCQLTLTLCFIVILLGNPCMAILHLSIVGCLASNYLSSLALTQYHQSKDARPIFTKVTKTLILTQSYRLQSYL